MERLLEQQEFFKKYNIKKEEFEKTGLKWSELEEIYNDYNNRLPILERAATTIAEILRNHKAVHTVRARVKDPTHLIEKIIRKTLEKTKEAEENAKTADHNEAASDNIDYKINLENYIIKITDLIGIRILHLYKDQALEIDKMIRGNWEPTETPIIYYRKGDNTELISQEPFEQFQLKPHKFGYRSWHYLIKSKITKEEYIAEIQVRTIFEEGWSEIDHQLRYPYHLDNQLLKNHLLLLNRLAGSADEMTNNIRETMWILEKSKEKELKQEKMIEALKSKVNNLSEENKLKKDDYEALKGQLDELQRSQKVFTISSDLNDKPSLFSNEDAKWYQTVIPSLSIEGDNINNNLFGSPAVSILSPIETSIINKTNIK